jgi:hypothetical protein
MGRAVRDRVAVLAALALALPLVVGLVVAPAPPALADPAATPTAETTAPTADRWAMWTHRAYLAPSSAGSTAQAIPRTVAVRVPEKTTRADAVRALRETATRQGYTTGKVVKKPFQSKGYRAFTYKNIRHNLAARSGFTRIEHDAHHIYPNKFRPYFEKRGMKIDAPKDLRWWWSASHKSKAAEYNRAWEKWIRRNPNATQAEVRRFGRKMHRAYSKYYEKPGPRGCQEHTCRSIMVS